MVAAIKSRVSLVMPCYNKADYIGVMIDSILEQVWDNIEIIFVNDGSTDGTRDVIEMYLPKIATRGYKTLVIDQENAGVITAAKVGLESITGEYVCLIDVDDELSPVYVSTMADWLDKNPDYDCCVCGGINYVWQDNEKVFDPYVRQDFYNDDALIVEKWLLGVIRSSVWIYMLRSEYLQRCNIIETYYTKSRGSHEPGYVIPILTYGAKLKYFPLPLYHFNRTGEGHSRSKKFEHMQNFYYEYFLLCKKVINSLPNLIADNSVKKRYINASRISASIHTFHLATGLEGGKCADLAFKSLLDVVNDVFNYVHPFKIPSLCFANRFDLTKWLKEVILKKNVNEIKGRLIACGTLRKEIALILERLKGTEIEPCEIWEDNGDIKAVSAPCYSSLTVSDTVVVPENSEDIRRRIRSTARCNVKIIEYSELIELSTEISRLQDAKNIYWRQSKMNEKTKMLVVSSTFSTCGGVERFLLNFLNLFPEETYQIDLLLFDDSQDEARMFDLIPHNVNILPFLKQFSKYSTRLLQVLTDAGNEHMAVIRKYINDRNAGRIGGGFAKLPVGERFEKNWDLLKTICPSYDGYDVAVAIRNTLPLKIVADKVVAAKKFVFLHADYKAADDVHGGYFISQLTCEEPHLKKMDGIIFVTKQNANSFSELMPELSDKAKVLVNVSDYEGMVAKSDLFYPEEYSEDRFNILTIARINKQKGIDLLIHTARRLKEAGVNFQWFVLGKADDQALYNQTIGMLEMLDLADCVVHLESHQNPFPYYKHCDLYVQTSYYEGRPLSIEEAMVLNCPIVSTNFSSVYDQIRDGENGIICSGDASHLADSIKGLLDNDEERTRLANANSDYKGNEELPKYLDLFSRKKPDKTTHKVSMIVPCYNKLKFISEMLDSVIAQKWDNIELILVNDGSTDGTREMIELYVPKIKRRGFDLLIIDQGNQGLAASIRNGLMKATGDFVCFPDCDDVLDPRYVSAMASIMQNDSNCRWVVCDKNNRRWDYTFSPDDIEKIEENAFEYSLLESYLLWCIDSSVCSMMVRTSYLHGCKVLDDFDVRWPKVQEPQILIPLILGGARPFHVRESLYNYIQRDGSILTSNKSYLQKMEYALQYDDLLRRVLTTRGILDEYINQLLVIGYFIHKMENTWAFRDIYNNSEAAEGLAKLFNESGLSKGKTIDVNQAALSDFYSLKKYISNELVGLSKLNDLKSIKRKKNGRIIAYAAFGRAAMRVKSELLNSDIRPDVYWDIAAVEGDMIANIPVVKPDFESLNCEDTVLLLLKSKVLIDEVNSQFESHNVGTSIWDFGDVEVHLAKYRLGL